MEITRSILVMGVVSFVCRSLPILCFRKPIQNPFLKSFLYYVPYVTLAVMTFPAILQTTRLPIAGIYAMIVGVFSAWNHQGLFKTSLFCCLTVLLIEGILL